MKKLNFNKLFTFLAALISLATFFIYSKNINLNWLMTFNFLIAFTTFMTLQQKIKGGR